MLPKDIAGHHSLPHNSQQDTAFHGRPAIPVGHLQLQTSQCHRHGPSHGELDQRRAHMGTPVLATTAATSLACGRPWSSASLARRPGRDEQDPSPVRQRLLGQPVQGDPLPGGHARHQPPDLRVGPCCRQTYHGDLLWPRTPESHVWNILMWKPSCTPAGCRNTMQYLIKWPG